MLGPQMRAALHTLARDFDQVAVPEHGRYVEAEEDVDLVSIPPMGS